MRRGVRFAKEWSRLAAGKSWVGRVVRAVVVVTAVLSVFDPANLVVTVRFPLVAGATWVGLTLFLTFITGMAWERAEGPKLWVSDRLEEDAEHWIFRLRVRNVGRGTIQARATVTHVLDDHGHTIISPATLPLELHWSHHPHPGQRADLIRGGSDTVGVVSVTSDGRVTIEGMFHSPHFFSCIPRNVYARAFDSFRVGVQVLCEGTSPEHREFHFVCAPGSPIRIRPIEH